MTKYITVLFLSTLTFGRCFAQSTQDIDKLLDGIYKVENSRDITKNVSSRELKKYGSRLLPSLVPYFSDTTLTGVKSDCQSKFLNKGEVAIIVADYLEGMPYYALTHVQNCLVSFCDNNPNLIEYYLWEIKRDGVMLFKKRYSAWLNSADRCKWPFYLYNKRKEHF